MPEWTYFLCIDVWMNVHQTHRQLVNILSPALDFADTDALKRSMVLVFKRLSLDTRSTLDLMMLCRN